MDELIVYKKKNNKLFFVSPDAKERLDYRISRQLGGFGVSSLLTYTASYIINLQTNTLIKNVTKGDDWPKQVFDAVFSGVNNAIEL